MSNPVDDLARELWEAYATHNQSAICFPTQHWDEVDTFTRDTWRMLARVAQSFPSEGVAMHAQRTLTASHSQATALQRRRLAELLHALRSKIEQDPGCGLLTRIGRAEGHCSGGRLAEGYEEARNIEKALQLRADAVLVEEGLNENLKLEAARDNDAEAQPSRTTAGAVNIPGRDGLLWMVSKNQIGGVAQRAAEKYRADFEAAAGSLGSAIANLGGAGGGAPKGGRSLADKQFDGSAALDDARRKALNGDGPLIQLMDEVAGKGATLRDLAKGDKHVASDLLSQFRVACRLLARHYGYGR